ncbi:MAG: tetratricopeptide repeat protein, partial [Pseudomonadota bacterium]
MDSSKGWTERVRRFAAALALSALLAGCATAPPEPTDAGAAHPAAGAYAEAIAASRTGDPEAGAAALLAFVERYPDVAEAHASLGVLHARAGRDDAALASLETALALDPALPAAHNELGMLHRRAGRFEQARLAYARALDIDANHANAHRNLGVLYDLYLGKPAQALPHYERYRELAVGEDALVAKWVTDLKRRIEQ